jgi:Protein of Unknown function (DUF2784)
VYALLADLTLLVHFLIVLFVVGGLIMIVAGNLAGWPWVNTLHFRILHLAAIAVVAAQSWFGLTCPLTTLESWLRQQAGAKVYETSFIEHWLHQLLFYSAPTWVFALIYTLFGLLVAAMWWRFPPKRS